MSLRPAPPSRETARSIEFIVKNAMQKHIHFVQSDLLVQEPSRGARALDVVVRRQM
jgi:chemotaxis methyl-accepting protein methylase